MKMRDENTSSQPLVSIQRLQFLYVTYAHLAPFPSPCFSLLCCFTSQANNKHQSKQSSSLTIGQTACRNRTGQLTDERSADGRPNHCTFPASNFFGVAKSTLCEKTKPNLHCRQPKQASSMASTSMQANIFTTIAYCRQYI